MTVDVHAAMSEAAYSHRAPAEPLLEADEIQGNVIPGFMKPRMAVIALAFADLDAARRWIGQIVPSITTLAGVMPSRVAVRAERLARRLTAGHTDVVQRLDDQWLNIAFSRPALGKLLTDPTRAGDPAKFADEAFAAGLAARSALLGDPTDPGAEGNPANWRSGGPGKEADVLLVLGADKEATMTRFLAQVRAAATGDGKLTVLYEEQGAKLDALGSEQFGFQDGVSQPGVRGRIPGDPPTFMTPRTIDPATLPEAWLYALPGQYLVWPGEFVFGYATQGADPLLPAPPQVPGPAWSRNGSYLVFRRLRQDVAGFRAFIDEQAEALRAQPGFADMTPELLGSSLFGRWHSGAPLSRAPAADNPALGRDPLANNHFGFAADTQPLPLVGGAPPDDFPEAKADSVGLTCPLASHIRKVNTRDVGSDQGGRRASFKRRLLRRGLPFGPRLPESGEDPVDGDRGLLFVSYQASIVDQFEFLNQAWMGDPIAPRSPSGFDMVIGQNGQPGADRARTCQIVRATGDAGNVTAAADVVVPTGGGYFFSPSISALRDVLAVPPSH